MKIESFVKHLLSNGFKAFTLDKHNYLFYK